MRTCFLPPAVIRYVLLGIDLGDRYYEFAVDDQGVVTELVHTPAGGREAGRE